MRRLLSFLLLALVAACSASLPVPSVRSVEPSELFQQLETTVLIRGDFRTSVKVDFQAPDASFRDARFVAQLERGEAVIGLFDVRWLEPGLLEGRVPAGLPEGDWAMRLSEPSGRQAVLAAAVLVRDCTFERCLFADGGVFDAGPPGALPDGGRRDAGSLVDAGVDAGVADEEDAGPPDAGPQPCGTFTFADDDDDGVGRPDSGAFLCGSGRAPVATDCDDVDPGTFPGAREFCNRVDDDCDGQVDEGACPLLNPSWIRRLDTSTDRTWRTVAPFGAGKVWIAGNDDVWVRADGGFFENVSGSCPDNIRSAWADGDGAAIIGGGNPTRGRLTTHQAGASSCTNTRMLTDPIVGIFGAMVDGGTLIRGVLRNGRVFEWRPPGQPFELEAPLPPGTELERAAVGGDGTLMAVGGDGASMRAFRWTGSAWSEERLSRLGLPAGRLLGVDVLSQSRALAVGEQGVVLEKIGRGWRQLPAPTPGAVTAVRAFNQARVYVTTSAGLVRRWNGRTWETRAVALADGGVSLNAIDGLTESELWAAGTRGWVVHWPE